MVGANYIGTELHIVYVLPMDALPFPLYYARDSFEADLERARQESRAFLDEQAKLIEDEGGVVAGVHLETGRPDQEIVRLGEELEAGLVVLGSRGLGGLKRALWEAFRIRWFGTRMVRSW
jgi:nucleotide-binding universal stress UspA family protein